MKSRAIILATYVSSLTNRKRAGTHLHRLTLAILLIELTDNMLC